MSYIADGRFSHIDNNDVAEFLDNLVSVPQALACDTETTYSEDIGGVLRYIKGTPNNYPFCVTMSDGKEGWYIEVNPVTIPALRKFFESGKVTTVWFNQKYDMHMLANIDINLHRNSYDVASIHHLIQEEDYDENDDRVRDLKGLSVKYLDKDADRFEKMVLEARTKIAKDTGRKLDEVSYAEVPTDIMVDYACADTLYTKQLFDLWMPAIKAQELDRALDAEMLCLFAVFETERNGMLVDTVRLAQLKDELQTNIDRITKEIFTLVGQEFNLNSSNELVAVFNSLGIDYHFKTDKDEWQTDVTAMEYFTTHDNATVAQLAKLILEYRGEEKLLNTFIANIEEYLQADGRVHPDFWLTGARTGRMSSSNPNFQNYPKSDKRIRQLYIPSPGHIFVYMDASQEEYRLLAHYAQDKGLIKAIEDGLDIHKATASILYNVPYEEVTDEQRNIGKRMNFATVYGLGEAAIAKNIGCKIDEITYKEGGKILREKFNVKPWELPPKEKILSRLTDEKEIAAVEYYYSDEARTAIAKAKEFKKQYFGKFPGIQVFIKNCRDVAKRRGYVFNWLGRRRRFRNPAQENYKAPNALIQGGCGDILKDRGGAVWQYLKSIKSNWRFVNWVHDEICWEVPLEELHLIPNVQAVLQDLHFRVPITFDIEWTNINWSKKFKFESVEKLREELGLSNVA